MTTVRVATCFVLFRFLLPLSLLGGKFLNICSSVKFVVCFGIDCFKDDGIGSMIHNEQLVDRFVLLVCTSLTCKTQIRLFQIQVHCTLKWISSKLQNILIVCGCWCLPGERETLKTCTGARRQGFDLGYFWTGAVYVKWAKHCVYQQQLSTSAQHYHWVTNCFWNRCHCQSLFINGK